ncbi:MAG: hypothetical protein ACQETI_13955 [Halobacteriota archaeon]
MYLSHPVRRVRDDPTPGKTASLVVELDDGASIERLEAAVSNLGGTVEPLRFSSRVELPEPAVADLCEVSGVVRIETTDVLGLALDDSDERG